MCNDAQSCTLFSTLLGIPASYVPKTQVTPSTNMQMFLVWSPLCEIDPACIFCMETVPSACTTISCGFSTGDTSQSHVVQIGQANQPNLASFFMPIQISPTAFLQWTGISYRTAASWVLKPQATGLLPTAGTFGNQNPSCLGASLVLFTDCESMLTPHGTATLTSCPPYATAGSLTSPCTSMVRLILGGSPGQGRD